MDKQKFPLSAEAAQNIEDAFKELKQQIEAKKYALAQQRQDYRRNTAEKHAQLDAMNMALSQALQSVETAVQNIDKVVEEDGSGHNNN